MNETITILEVVGILFITMGSYVSREMAKEARQYSLHRFLLMTKLSAEEYVIYMIIVMFAEILYIIMLLDYQVWYIVVAMVFVIQLVQHYVWGEVANRIALRYMYRVSQFTTIAGILCLLI